MLRGPAAAALVFTGFFTAWVVTGFGGADATQAFDDVATTVVPLVAAVACVVAAVRSERGARRGWAFIGASAFAWGLGNTVWSFYELVLGRDVPFPSLADAGYLAAVPLAAIGMLAFPSATLRLSRARALLDGLVIAGALLIVSWVTVLDPVYAASSGGWVATWIGLAYPIGDVVVVSIVLFVLTRSREGARLPFLLVAGALVAMAFADSAFAYTTATGTYQTGNLLDAGWVVGYLLIALGAIETAASRDAAVPDRPRDLTLASTLVPYVALGFALLAGAAHVVLDGYVDFFIFWTVGALFLLVLARQFITLRENLALRRVTESALARLQKLEAERTQMLHNVTHDLLGPLTPMKIHVSLLRSSCSALPTATKRSIDVIERNLDQQTRLVSDLRDLSHLESGKLRVEPCEMALDEALGHTLASYREDAASRGIALVVRSPKGLRILADPARVTQVLTNLVTNALKFTPRDGEITIEADAVNGCALVRVRDTGRGLTPDEISRLFQPFTQVHAAGEIQEKGTGLGLYICRGLVERHGGRLWVESAGRGRGSTFLLTFPLAQAPAATTRLPAATRANELI